VDATPNEVRLRKLFLKAPSFLVIHGRVHWSQGGIEGILNILTDTLSYKKHGKFKAEYTGDSYAIIHHTTTGGKVKKLFVPPEKRLYVSNGRLAVMDVNYQSFLEGYAEDGSPIFRRGRARS
jgi:hypothetical protein